MAQSINNPTQQMIADWDSQRLSGCGHNPPRTDTLVFPQRQKQNSPLPEADHLRRHHATRLEILQPAELADLGGGAIGFDRQPHHADNAPGGSDRLGPVDRALIALPIYRGRRRIEGQRLHRA
jgi:hypothetical protein